MEGMWGVYSCNGYKTNEAGTFEYTEDIDTENKCRHTCTLSPKQRSGL